MSIETDLLLVKQKVEQIEAQLSSKITYNQLSTLAGNGLAGSGATTLDVNVDNSTLEINLDTLRVKDGGITSAKILDGTIVAGDIANDTLTATQIAVDAIGSSELADNAVDTAAIAALAVTTAKITDANVTNAKLANGAVTTLKTDISFATTAARDAAITSPVAGMTAYINSNDVNEGLYSYTGTRWNKGPSWNAPWGFLVRGVASGNSGIGALQDLTGMTATYTFVANRNIEIRTQVLWATSNMASPHYWWLLYEGAGSIDNYVMSSLRYNNAFGWTEWSTGSHWLSPTAGAHTYKVRASGFAGSNTGIVGATSSQICIIDHGPNGAPA